jgi:hypothetical protein
MNKKAKVLILLTTLTSATAMADLPNKYRPSDNDKGTSHRAISQATGWAGNVWTFGEDDQEQAQVSSHTSSHSSQTEKSDEDTDNTVRAKIKAVGQIILQGLRIICQFLLTLLPAILH